ncbi:MAG: 3-dehydroquinate synthase [Ruminococcaceae bacterium]|nr:3-dehydroquinate synthase [Oscillospiraceae bacterium]
MNTISVSASRNYDVLIGRGLLDTLGRHVTADPKVRKVAVISDDVVWSLYGERVTKSLQNAGLETSAYVFPNGEESKNAAEYLNILNHLAANGLTRTDRIIALGGGVVGDIAGFAAATYLRGIQFIQVPTTLLAMVDSSVGGKTAIDLPAGKNLCGAFWQPSLVLCDIDTLDTLPDPIFRDGCAEVIKYGILYDPALFAHLEQYGTAFDRIPVISRCVELKRDVVAEDEFDTGARMKLNLGHTFGHGIEAHSNFTVSHGKAVAMGMAIAARTSHCPDTDRILACLTKFGLPTTTACTADDICRYAFSDKKRAGGTVRLILPRAIGHCEIVPTPVEQLHSLVEEGL